ncbi:MAG: OadG family protein [Lentisphaerae bacterium]|jgi:sodium pump decarboxylase gamma subunit|nr:OadG family protein [Lentisphaerota bacterium]
MTANDLDLIISSLILLVAGMGATFAFLILQVWCTNISSKITARYSYLLPDPEPKKAAPKAQAAKPAGDDGELVAVISAAVQRHMDK